MSQSVFRDPAEQKAADQVHDQRSVRERCSGALLHDSLKAIASQCSHCSKRNQQSDSHDSPVSWPPRAPTKNSWTPGGGQELSVLADGSGELHRLWIGLVIVQAARLNARLFAAVSLTRRRNRPPDRYPGVSDRGALRSKFVHHRQVEIRPVETSLPQSTRRKTGAQAMRTPHGTNPARGSRKLKTRQSEDGSPAR
jgi:hypothetical protein